MGFKRTSDGRVFFKGPDNTANDHVTDNEAEMSGATGLRRSDGQQQPEILNLLKALNERLKVTQAERNHMRKQLESYRSVIEGLEDKAEKHERAFKSLEHKLYTELEAEDHTINDIMNDTLREIDEIRKAQQQQDIKLTKQSAHYGQLYKRMKESEQQQAQLIERVDETASKQDRLIRQVDRVAQDRARFMRKIERIEEAVIQTRDAVNAKANILPGEGSLSPAEAEIDDALLLGDVVSMGRDPALQPKAEKSFAPSISQNTRSVAMQTGVAVILSIAALSGGWFIGQSYMNNPSFSAAEEAVEDGAQSMISQEIERAIAQDGAGNNQAQDWAVSRDMGVFDADQGADSADAQDFEMPSTDELKARFSEDQESLGQDLNAIEPRLNTQDITEPVSQAQMRNTQEARLTPQNNAAPVKAPAQTALASTRVEPDPLLPDVIKPIEADALAGVPEAQHDLGAVYTAGHAGAPQDYKKAAIWFQKAADQGIPNAAYNLGVLYHQGLGVDADIDEALRWYDMAAEMGHAEGQYNLGIAYIEGIGVSYDAEMARDYFESAAQGGVMEAAYNLGLIYENGLLGEPRPDEALMWYKHAADKGSPEAKTALEQLANTLGIKLEDVNRLVEDMKSAKAKEVAPEKTAVKAAPPVKALKEEVRAPVQTAKASPTQDLERGYQQILITQMQEYLMNAGLYPGPVDGRLGPLTSDAIRTYQTAADLPVTGQPTTELLTHMLSGNGRI